MNSFFQKGVLWVVALALGLLGGCASAPQERLDLHMKAMQQTIEANDVELSRACRQERESAIASAKYEAISQDDTAESWQQYYRAPVCVLKEKQKKEASRHQIPEEFGFTMEDLAKLDYDKLCESSPLKRMGTGKGMVWLAEQGVSPEYYNAITAECHYRDNRAAEKRWFVRSFFPTVHIVGTGFVPAYGYGYRPYGYRYRGHHRRGYYGDSRCTTVTPGGHVADPGLPLCQ
ncbi:MAG: hypothetical protein NUV49_02305 [Patescibacteria group bacterium]|nr:hypothetical protein [Patescibacteria group bacterium]